MELIHNIDLFEKYAAIGINRLGIQTKEHLSQFLNQTKVLPTDDGLPRDWQGLAKLVAVPSDRIIQLESDEDPTQKVLSYWCYNSPEESTVQRLLSYLERLDRFDIIDDIRLLIDEDIHHSGQNASNVDLILNPIDSNNMEILTRHDYTSYKQGNGPQLYDALVLFVEEDRKFANELIKTMEEEFNLMFCTESRDLIAGSIVVDSMLKLIEERCQRMIAILSNHFFKSPYMQFFASYGNVVGIEERKRKIIPINYEPCEIPRKWKIYQGLNFVDYERSNLTAHFWARLNDAVLTLKPKMSIQEQLVRSPTSISKPKTGEESNTLKDKKEGITFSSSLEDVNNGEQMEQKKTDLMLSTSKNSLHVIDSECTKKKNINWLKKILHNYTKEKIERKKNEKSKNLFFLRSSNRKAVAITS